MPDGTPELHEIPDHFSDLRIRPVAAPDNPLQNVQATITMYDPNGAAETIPKTQVSEYGRKGYTTIAPTQFEKDRPGKPLSGSGVASASGDVLTNQVLGAAVSNAKKVINPIGAAIDDTKSFVDEVRAGWNRGKDPRAKVGEAVLSGLGSRVGVSAKSSAEHAKRGESNEIVAEGAVPAVETLAAAVGPKLKGIEGNPEAGATSFSGAKGGYRPNYSGLRVREVETPQGGHAGGEVASVEELSRPGRFVKINRAGIPTDQGKVPDFKLDEGEAGYQVKPDGTYELKAGDETPHTKRGVENYAKEVFKSPKKLVEDQGLVYKGELVKGSGVHMFEHPDHPGKTAALPENILSAEKIMNKMQSKLREFGVDVKEKK